MTPNDAQIDLLLRRHAGQARPARAKESLTEHLDADELNAFAEGSLPAATRSRFVSHLADCDDCRRVASQIAISAGAVVAAEAKNTADPQGYSRWQRLSGFFAPLTLRYAAFAVVLIAVVGVTFLVMRRPREANFVARNEPANQPQVSAVKPSDSAPPAGFDQARQVNTNRPSATPAAATNPIASKQEEFKAGQLPAPPPKPEQETETTSPALAAKKAAAPVAVQSSPSYAPPPPGEAGRAGKVANERQEMQRNAPSAPRKSDSPFDKSKMMDQSRAGELSKDNRVQDDSNRAAVSQNQTQGTFQNQANIQRNADEKNQTERGRDVDAVSSSNRSNSASQAPARQSAGTGGAKEEEPLTRSAGGRKFRRQGNAWVDSKFKSSMTTRSISRGSSEFDALDSGLRSIAQQFSGEVIVVWKGKAYLIR